MSWDKKGAERIKIPDKNFLTSGLLGGFVRLTVPPEVLKKIREQAKQVRIIKEG